MVIGRKVRSFASRAVASLFLCAVAGSGVGCVAREDGSDAESGEFAAVAGCKHDIGERRLLCPGDRVLAHDIPGTVLGFNPTSRQVLIDLDWIDENRSYRIEDVAVTYGCIYQFCVGDVSVSGATAPDKGKVGRIIGVNPYNKHLVLDLDGIDAHYPYQLQGVHYGHGCMRGRCIGDRVGTPSGRPGVLIGLNPFRLTAAVDIDGDPDTYLHRVDSIFVINESDEYAPELRNPADPYNLSMYTMDSSEFEFTTTRR